MSSNTQRDAQVDSKYANHFAGAQPPVLPAFEFGTIQRAFVVLYVLCGAILATALSPRVLGSLPDLSGVSAGDLIEVLMVYGLNMAMVIGTLGAYGVAGWALYKLLERLQNPETRYGREVGAEYVDSIKKQLQRYLREELDDSRLAAIRAEATKAAIAKFASLLRTGADVTMVSALCAAAGAAVLTFGTFAILDHAWVLVVFPVLFVLLGAGYTLLYLYMRAATGAEAGVLPVSVLPMLIAMVLCLGIMYGPSADEPHLAGVPYANREAAVTSLLEQVDVYCEKRATDRNACTLASADLTSAIIAAEKTGTEADVAAGVRVRVVPGYSLRALAWRNRAYVRSNLYEVAASYYPSKEAHGGNK